MGEVLQQEGLIEHPLPIENRTGATGAVWLSQMVTERQGRDDVIAVTSLPIMSNKLRGDSEYGYEDVTMISRMITEYYMVAVPADSEYETAEDLLAAIEEDPDAVPVGAAGDDRLPMALLVKAAGGDPQSINFVAYEGGGEQIAAMLNGDIRAAVAGVSEFRGQIEAGDLRGLTVIRDERLAPPLDDIPTAREEGYDVELENWRGIYGPPDMPEEAVTYWQDTIQRMTETQAWEETAAKNQWETTYMEGEEFRNYLDETYESVRAGLRETGEIQ
jgi:putative tricarboxylic transport membrane protein